MSAAASCSSRGWRIAGLLGGAALVLVACDDGPCATEFCGRCIPPLTLCIVDTDTGRAPPTEVVVDGTGEVECAPPESRGAVVIDAEEQSCPDDAIVCVVGVDMGAGVYEATVEADGFAIERVEELVTEDVSDMCCSCGYDPLVRDVQLEPVGG
jgi:hypothetical protein